MVQARIVSLVASEVYGLVVQMAAREGQAVRLNHMREEQMEPRQAIREAVHNRIRPIFMSVSTSVFGMLPLVLFPGAASEF